MVVHIFMDKQGGYSPGVFESWMYTRYTGRIFFSLLLFLRLFCTCLQNYWQNAPSTIKTQEFTYWILTLALYREWKWPLISRVGKASASRKHCFLSSCTSVSSFSLWTWRSQIGIYTLSKGWLSSGSWLDGIQASSGLVPQSAWVSRVL